MYFAGLRPAEAAGLRRQDCELPATGWGLITVKKTRPQANKRYTDSGETFDDRGLKHREGDIVRPVPIPPELVALLREHLDAFGTAEDGRLFVTGGGQSFSGSAYAQVWKRARGLALTPDQVESPLAARPYDLRHAAVSLWLNAGVHAPEAAERAGHGVDVMLRVYAKCIDGQRDVANQRIEDALVLSATTVERLRSIPGPLSASGLTCANAAQVIPRIFREQCRVAAFGGIWLHPADLTQEVFSQVRG
ncbi:tyrosine-type recombinase/integrase [Actinomadura darangshiensis]